MNLLHRIFFTVTCFTIIPSTLVSADTWPQFRGATGDGVSAESNLPTQWSKGKGVAWSTELPGRANSSPAVTANRIDLTTQKSDSSLWVISIDRKSGKILKSTNVGSGKLAAKGPANLYAHRHNAATPTPAADDKNVYAFFGSGLLVCVDAKSGQIKWKHDMVKKYGPYDITFGMGSSPRLWGDLLYVSCMTKGPSYVVAFDKSTGKEVWKSDRQLPAKDDGPDAYSTPVVYKNNGREELLISGADHVNAYDLLTGTQLWVSNGLTIASPYGRVIASPAGADGIVVATSGNPGGSGRGLIVAVSTAGKGDLSKNGRLWTYAKTTPDSSTPVCLGGSVYMTTDAGVATSLNLKTGKVNWQKRIGKGPFHSAAVAGDGKVYFTNAAGACTVVKADSSGSILATNQLPGLFYSTPAISDGTIYFRAYERLYAVTGK